MAKKAIFPLTLKLTAGKLIDSKFTIAAGAAFPCLLAWVGLRDSYDTMVKFFLFIFPHLFLLAARDMTATEVAGGSLENVLFLRGRLKAYLWQKNGATAVVAGAYCLGLFSLVTVCGLVRGGFELRCLVQLGLGLLAGLYYVSAAGTLGYFLRSGANVLVVILVQAGVLVGLLFSATARAGFIDHLAAGRFPGLAAKAKFLALVAVCPNLIVARPLAGGAVLVAAGLAGMLAGQRLRIRRLDIMN